MPILILALFFCVMLALSAGIILSIASRYRAGTARRQGRRWVATANVWSTAFGAGFFLLSTAFMSIWLHQAFVYSLLGMLAGMVLGGFGLLLTRWENHQGTFYYTPNRWLALIIVFALIGRLAYGWWRSVHMIEGQPHPWISGSATALSLAVAAGVIGYYLIYAIGVRRRFLRHDRARPLSRMTR